MCILQLTVFCRSCLPLCCCDFWMTGRTRMNQEVLMIAIPEKQKKRTDKFVNFHWLFEIELVINHLFIQSFNRYLMTGYNASKELMPLNCGVGKDSGESLRLQGD